MIKTDHGFSVLQFEPFTEIIESDQYQDVSAVSVSFANLGDSTIKIDGRKTLLPRQSWNMSAPSMGNVIGFISKRFKIQFSGGTTDSLEVTQFLPKDTRLAHYIREAKK